MLAPNAADWISAIEKEILGVINRSPTLDSKPAIVPLPEYLGFISGAKPTLAVVCVQVVGCKFDCDSASSTLEASAEIQVRIIAPLSHLNRTIAWLIDTLTFAEVANGGLEVTDFQKDSKSVAASSFEAIVSFSWSQKRARTYNKQNTLSVSNFLSLEN